MAKIDLNFHFLCDHDVMDHLRVTLLYPSLLRSKQDAALSDSIFDLRYDDTSGIAV